MSQCNAALLSDRAVVRVSGPAASSFLQGLITNDIDKAKPAGAIHAGLLTPQGKILFDFFVVPAGEGFLLEIAKAKAAELVQRLGFYRLRAEVEIAEDPVFAVAAAWGEPARRPDGALAYADPRLPALGERILLPAGTSLGNHGCTQTGEDKYHAHRIALGVPEGGRDYAFGDAFPHEAMFDRLVGVEGEGPLPPSGTDITAGGASIGTLGSVSGSSGLALLRLDRAEEAKAAGVPLRAGEVTVALRMPAWTRLKTPAAAAS